MKASSVSSPLDYFNVTGLVLRKSLAAQAATTTRLFCDDLTVVKIVGCPEIFLQITRFSFTYRNLAPSWEGLEIALCVQLDPKCSSFSSADRHKKCYK